MGRRLIGRCPRDEARYLECSCRCHGCRWSCSAHEAPWERATLWLALPVLRRRGD